MATLRMASGLPSRPDEPIRARRAAAAAAYTEPKEDVQNTTRRIRREGENIRIAIQQPTQSKPVTQATRIASARRPSIPMASNRLPFPYQTQSWSSGSTTLERPSHVPTMSGSSSSALSETSTSNPTRKVLRRKQSSVGQKPPSLRHDSNTDSTRTSSSSSAPRPRFSLDPAAEYHLDRGITESPTEIRIAHVVDLPKTQAQAVTIYPELDRYREYGGRPSMSSEGSSADFLHRLATHDLPPPTPVFSGTSSQLSAFSASPSTRFSESTSPGPYSRDTTPTSMSSQSPGLVAPIRLPVPRVRQVSPAMTRPPVSGRRAGSIPNEMEAFSADPHGLAAVRESLTSSSSNSTVREGDRKETKKKRRLSPLPPSPPPRKSSQKFAKSPGNDESPSKTSLETAAPLMTSPKLVQSPPRLAPAASPRATPPARPSRDNTPDLQSQLFDPWPVIHSNLSSTSLLGDRRGPEPQIISRSTTPLSYAEPPPQPLVRQQVGREATPAPRSSNAPETKKNDGRVTRTPSPNTSTFSRFVFFGRRSKTTPEAPQVDKKDKPARKGPAAGTGHEGYGRLGGIRRKSGSSTTNLARPSLGPGSSQDSLSSSQPSDTFLLDRMNPVVISGGEIIENRNHSVDLARSESNQSLGHGSEVSTTSSAGRGLAPSAIPRGRPHPSLSSRRPSDSSESEAVTMKSTLAFRRSVQRLRSSPDQSPLKLPQPINTAGITSPSINSQDTTILSDDSQFEMHREVIRGRIAAATAQPPKKLVKRARSPRKWNLFSRSQNQPNTKKEKEAIPVAATVKIVQHKPAAFYTLMDGSEQEDTSPQDVEEILREAKVFDLPSPLPLFKERRTSSASQEQRRESLSRLLQPTRSSQARRNSATAAPKSTSIPAIRSMKPTHTSQSSASKLAEARPSRLPQVGRIPKVVTSRPEHTSSRSFSRPFNRISLQKQPQAAGFNPDFVASGPTPPEMSTPELSRGESTETSDKTNSDPRTSLLPDRTPEMIHIGNEFLTFSPRKNSERTTSTDSSSCGMYTLADALAFVPNPDAPLVEDEIWDEYNDLIGEVPPSATSSRGVPFHLETYGSRISKRSLKPLESPTITSPPKPLEKSAEVNTGATTSSVYSADMTERLKAAFALKPEEDSTTIVPVAEVPASVIDRESTELARRATAASQRSSGSSRKSRQSDCSCRSSEDESPLSQVNLRVGSMTVSKWLSFGHVLFSPARDQLLDVVGSLKRHSILVVDGLGNDDWSFYAAETYPAATFFNLSPRAPLPEEHKNSSSFPLSPPNHHQIQYLSHTEKFPFGPESFTSVVFRFAAAAPESHYRNIVSEARRVLKPGGYLELSILDVDLNNMGNRGRRTIRRLKERIHERNPEISIGSTSDIILRLLGRKGFSDVKTCRVGVPVASIITRSDSGSKKPPVARSRKSKEVRSLAEMMNDDGESADENITKMVARVGRWWYTRCYESAAGTANSKSMWTDRALLSECEELRTSFKLMVCYARVPERARTASI
ncbi:Putative S-adenosyl-L-methionine-dependent methyltransferase superfamily [Colletotrichum destructivum]|uniref:S-adenosyl-L-methionine-dependent methyltransferase superfamily n=1 Tax=Colletotrichum destructivum TaxID=34406 RepID=A0AAX4J2H8_9PEZI|nr:Putative S-adenosyl-L-methionine-dependent methyltransferase superfamily [Colletotrichum destructivum]